MAKAKVDVKQVKSVAQKGGVKIPPAPQAPVKVQKPEQLKKQAQERAKKRMKMLIRVAIFAAVALVIGLVVYLVKFHGRMPKDAFNTAVEYAYKSKTEKFRGMFSSDSIALVEAGDGNADESWAHLMNGISPTKKPEVKSAKTENKKGIETAHLTVLIDGEDRNVYMVKEDGAWKINLNVAINPQKLTLPDNIPPEYLQNFEYDEDEAWWENPGEDEDGGDKGKGGKGGGKGFLSKIFKR